MVCPTIHRPSSSSPAWSRVGRRIPQRLGQVQEAEDAVDRPARVEQEHPGDGGRDQQDHGGQEIVR